MTQNSLHSNDLLDRFMADRAELGAGNVESKGAFYAAYCAFLIQGGEVPLPKHALGRKMSAKGFAEFRSKKTRFWEGLRLLESLEEPVNEPVATFHFESAAKAPLLVVPESLESALPSYSEPLEPASSPKPELGVTASSVALESAANELLMRNMMGHSGWRLL